MYLRYRDNWCRVGPNSPAETAPREVAEAGNERLSPQPVLHLRKEAAQCCSACQRSNEAEPREEGSLPSPGITRLPRYCEPLRLPRAPGLSLAGIRLVALGSPVLRALSLCTCCRHYPGAAAGRTTSLVSPCRISLPRKGCRVGLHIVLFEMLWGGGGEIISIVADVNRWSPQWKRRST